MTESAAESILKDIAAEQGWSVKAQLEFALQFIDQQDLESQFEDFLIEQQESENEDEDSSVDDESLEDEDD